MALQGDLSSFALPDVLRLLAGTAKTGRLGVSANHGSGEVWLCEGDLVGGSVTTSQHAKRAADVVFELLRFDEGSFLFDDGEEAQEPGEPSGVDEAISAAQALLVEWTEVEAVVPSMNSWVSLVTELDGTEVTVTAPQWKLLAALGGGATVRALGNRFEITDLKISRRVKGLVEAGLVELGDPVDEHEDARFADVGAESVAHALAGDLALLSAEAGPVVMESHEDALLPEPLPGEGTTFAGDIDALGTVDGRSFESIEAEAALAAEPTASWPPYATGDVNDVAADRVAYDSEMSPLPADEDAADDFAAAWAAEALSSEPAADDEIFDEVADETVAVVEADSETSVEIEAERALEVDADSAAKSDERGSLLKFLSSVKP